MSESDALRATHHPLLADFLHARGIATPDAIHRFLEPEYDTHTHDPFLLTDMGKAVDRVLHAITSNEHIVIYSDYDCDGIPGGVLLHDFFASLEFSNFENHIPHRHHDGYGFNAASVPAFHERNTQLIITVDCGITDHAAVEAAASLGIDTIVTDHHEPKETLPPAYAVINPKRDDAYPFAGICGTTVAFKLVQAVIRTGKERGIISLKEGWEKWWLDLVGIATIADMVPLIDENRVFARYGLAVLRKSRRPGLQHLLRKAGSNQHHLTEDDIGFTIAPRINAASRMDTPEDAFHMLRTTDEGEAGMRVAHLEKLNNERRGVVASMTKEAKKRLSALPEVPSVIVLGNGEWRPSLAGLVANALAEEYKRPTFIWGRDGQGVIKGSCRSGGSMSIIELMEHAHDAFLTFGGHHASGGFSVDHTALHTLHDALIRAHADMPPVARSADVPADAYITLADITPKLIRSLEALAPYGARNPKPVFEIRNAIPSTVEVFGKAHDHTKLRFVTDEGTLDAIAFFRLPETFTTLPKKGNTHTLRAHIERSYFMGRMETRLRLLDIL